MNRRTALTYGVLPVLGLARPAVADEPKKTPSPATAAKLTVEKLREMLEAIETKPEIYRDASGVVRGSTATFAKGDLTFAFHAVLTVDSSTVWLKVKLVKVADLEGVPAIVFLKLLAANWSITPAYFAYSDDESELYLMMPTIAPGLTANGLKSNLLALAGITKDKIKLWHPSAWPRLPEKKAQPEERKKSPFDPK